MINFTHTVKCLFLILLTQSVVLFGNNYDYSSNIYQEYLIKNNKKPQRFSIKNFTSLKKMISNYDKIRENKEKYDFILNIKNQILKDYMELRYYQEIDNEISFQKKISSLKVLDIFLTLPFVISELKINNYQEYQKLIKEIYFNNKNNLPVLLFYENEFLENNLDLSLIEDKFLDDRYHLSNVIEQTKKYKYNIAIKKIQKLLKYIPKSDKKNKVLLFSIIKWNEFFRNDKNFIDLKQIYKFSDIEIGLVPIFDKNGDKEILTKNFFKEELNTLSNQELKYENKILKKIKNITLDDKANYIIDVQEGIRFANLKIKNLFYEIMYIDKEENIKIKNAIIIKEDGEIIKVKIYDYLVPYEYDGLYSDMRILRFNLKEKINSGDIFYINYKIVSTNKRDYFNKKISITEHIKPISDIINYKFSLNYPKKLKINIAYNKKYLKKTSKEYKKYKKINFIGHNIKQYIKEAYYPFSYKEEAYISISNFSNWKDVKTWFKNIIFDESYVLSDKNKKYFKSLISISTDVEKHDHASLHWEAKEKEEIVKYFYNYILDNIHYVGIELGIHSYKPYNPNLVFENKYGDCKDRAILFYNIMKLFNIEAKIVIVSSSDSDQYDFSVPSYSYFNHAIVYIPFLDKFLDLTNNKIAYTYLPTADINSKILVLNENTDIKTLKFKDNELIKKEFTYKRQNNDLKVIHKEYYYGNTSLSSIKNDFKTLGKLVYERYINKYYNELTTLISYKTNNSIRNIPYILEFEYLLNNKLNTKIFKLFQEDDLFEKKFTPLNNRVNSLNFITTSRYEYSFKFINLKKISSFENKEINNTYFNASLTLDEDTIKFKFKINTKYITANEYNSFKNKLKELDEILSKSYYLEIK